VLARRVRDLQSLDKGLGGSIVTLTRQVELARGTLEEARGAAKESKHDLAQLVARADAAAAQLRLLLAAAGPGVATARPRPEPVAAEPKAAPAPEPAPVGPPAPAGPPRLAVAFPPEPAAEAPARAARPMLSEVPKPREMPRLDGLLRRRSAPESGAGEDDLIEALRLIASGGER
jgi:hypothetical protein